MRIRGANGRYGNPLDIRVGDEFRVYAKYHALDLVTFHDASCGSHRVATHIFD